MAHVFRHEVFFRLQHLGLNTLFAQEFDKRLVARVSLERAVELDGTFFHLFLVAACHFLLSFDQEFGAKVFLCINNHFYVRAELFEQLFLTAGDRTGDDQRRTGIIDQYGVDLIDNRIVVFALYQVVRADRHIVAQVVETEFVVRTECDICIVSRTTGIGVRLVFVDTVNGKPVEHIERAHPFRVTFGQVVVYGYDMHTITCQRVQEYRQGCHQCFTFTGRHFRNLTFMQNDTTEQLDIVVDHVPGYFVTAGNPMVVVEGFVAVNFHKVEFGSQVAVEVVCCHFDRFVLCETASRIFHDGEYFRKRFFQYDFHLFCDFFFDLVYFSPDRFTFFQFFVVDAFAQFFHFGAFIGYIVLDTLFDLVCFCTKLVVRELLD